MCPCNLCVAVNPSQIWSLRTTAPVDVNRGGAKVVRKRSEQIIQVIPVEIFELLHIEAAISFDLD